MSWFSVAAKAVVSVVKPILNLFAASQKPKVKQFVHDRTDEYYDKIDHMTEIVTVTGFVTYLKKQAGDSPLGKPIVDQLATLVDAGVKTGLLEMGLKATDALTRDEFTRFLSFIDKKIDGARF